MRGYFGIGIYHPKKETNIGSLWRSAYNFGADFIYTIGPRYQHQCSDTTKSWKHIPLYNYLDIDDLLNHLPHSCRLVGVELDDKSFNLNNFVHPERCCYLLGREDYGLPPHARDKCHALVEIKNTKHCLNVACSGSIILYDRIVKYG